MRSKKELAMELSALKDFKQPKERLEQYTTDGDLASLLLWNAHMIDGVQGKNVLDLGCGTGILGIGALMLGAKHVTMLDIDKEALEQAQQNIPEEFPKESYTLKEAAVMPVGADITVMNPPFGTRVRHADREFLKTAMQSTPIIYSIHLQSAERFITELASTEGFELTHAWKTELQLKKSLEHHKKKIERVPVVVVRLEKAIRL
jgi:putative methylase